VPYRSIDKKIKIMSAKVPKYTTRLFPVEVSQVITVSGKSTAVADRLDINLSSGNGACNEPGDIQFHLSIRFKESAIVRNSHTRCVGWGAEERQENLVPHCTANPINRGDDFKIAIYVDLSAFFVTINEKPFCVFPHRKPLKDIQRLYIFKDLEKIYQVDHTSAPPKRWPLMNPAIFSGLVPKQFQAGNVIVMTAVPRGNREDFTLNLLHVETGRNMFHLRPYLGSANIVINSQDEGFG
jgi:Galactoside-binding lectin